MGSYKVLAPCAVRSKDSRSAVAYTKYGQVVDVPHADDAALLVAGGFIEAVGDDSAPEVPELTVGQPDPPKPEDKSKPKPG